MGTTGVEMNNSSSRSSSSSTNNNNIKPMPCDVLLGRGRSNSHHAGNIHYQTLIRKYHMVYFSFRSQREKNILSMQIVNKIKENNNGRFLKKDNKDGRWKIVSDEAARIKVAHSLQYYERIRKKDNQSNNQTSPNNNGPRAVVAVVPTQQQQQQVAPSQLLLPIVKNYNNAIYINQTDQTLPLSGREQTQQQIQLEYESFDDEPLLDQRCFKASNDIVATFSHNNFDHNTESSKQDEKIKMEISYKGSTTKPSKDCNKPYLNGINTHQRLQTVKNAIVSTTTQSKPANILSMKSTTAPGTNRIFTTTTTTVTPQEAGTDALQVSSLSKSKTMRVAINNNPSQTRKNDKLSANKSEVDEESQERQSNSLLANDSQVEPIVVKQKIIPRNSNSSSCAVICSNNNNNEMSPNVCNSSSDFMPSKHHNNFVYDDYENSLVLNNNNNQEQQLLLMKKKTKSEYFAAQQLIELAYGRGISQN